MAQHTICSDQLLSLSTTTARPPTLVVAGISPPFLRKAERRSPVWTDHALSIHASATHPVVALVLGAFLLTPVDRQLPTGQSDHVPCGQTTQPSRRQSCSRVTIMETQKGLRPGSRIRVRATRPPTPPLEVSNWSPGGQHGMRGLLWPEKHFTVV